MEDAKLFRWLKIIQSVGIGLASILIPAMIAFNAEYNRKNEFMTRIQAEREQQDSTMREKMFTALIGSYFGKEGCSADPVSRLQLLHLLVVNFSEFFDAWPLFEDLEKELTEEKDRTRLYNLATQMVDRQINQLTKSGEQPQEYELCFEQKARREECAPQKFVLKTPGGDRAFSIELIKAVEPSRIRVRVAALPSPGESPQSSNAFRSVEFPVSCYSMPLMHHTLLEDGTRFSITLKNLDAKANHATVRVVTFPEGYMSLRDRPSIDAFYGRTPQRYALFQFW